MVDDEEVELEDELDELELVDLDEAVYKENKWCVADSMLLGVPPPLEVTMLGLESLSCANFASSAVL